MKPIKPVCGFNAGAVCLPRTRRSVAQWLAASPDHDQLTKPAKLYRGLVDILFDQEAMTTESARQAAQAENGQSFSIALDHSQQELARQALSDLRNTVGEDAIGASSLVTYSHSAIDENIFQSSVCCLASELKLSKTPHFSVAQLQGASWFQALSIVDAFFRNQSEMESAIVIAAEKWPLDYPRALPNGLVLGDGACAMQITRLDDAPGYALLATKVCCFDDFGRVYDPAKNLSQSSRAIQKAAIQVIDELLAEAGLTVSDIAVMNESGAGEMLDSAVLSHFGLVHNAVACAAENSGYLSAAHAPIAAMNIFDQLSRNGVDDGACVLLWGVGLAGSIGASIFQYRAG